MNIQIEIRSWENEGDDQNSPESHLSAWAVLPDRMVESGKIFIDECVTGPIDVLDCIAAETDDEQLNAFVTKWKQYAFHHGYDFIMDTDFVIATETGFKFAFEESDDR